MNREYLYFFPLCHENYLGSHNHIQYVALFTIVNHLSLIQRVDNKTHVVRFGLLRCSLPKRPFSMIFLVD